MRMGPANAVDTTMGVGGAADFPRPRLVEPISSIPTERRSANDGELAGDGAAREYTAPATHTLDDIVARVAGSRVSVLITGETGVGKEVMARRIHDSSPRANKPLISINCAAFCDTLIDSELFGFQKGAFTGAEQAKMGLIEAADGGTLFLDEVGELSAAAQAKLLRVLETRLVLRIGSVTPRLVDVRFICATNRDIDTRVAEGRFRADLRFRIEGVRLHLPPLRERPAEILPAAHQFLSEWAERDHLPLPTITPEAERALGRHTWSGNFRELRNVIERAALLCQGNRILPEDLRLPQAEAATSVSAGAAAATSGEPATGERERILAALRACAGNQTRAASMMGVSRRTFVTRLEAYGIPRPQTRMLKAVAPSSEAAPLEVARLRQGSQR